jgi:hypothetical protein
MARKIIEVLPTGAMKIRELVIFYLRAVERFRAHGADWNGPQELRDTSRARGALGEALNWADTIDLYLSKGPHGTLGTDRDPDWAASVDGANGELVRGFQYARNHVHHQWLTLVTVRIVMTGNDNQHTSWVWASAPAPKRSRRPKPDDYRDAYQRQLEDSSILNTLERLAMVFWQRRGWVIDRSDIEQPGYTVLSSIPFDPERDVR